VPDHLSHPSIVPPWADSTPVQLASGSFGDAVWSRTNYGTERFLTDNVEGERNVVAYPAGLIAGNQVAMRIEALSESSRMRFEHLGLRFAPVHVAGHPKTVQLIEEAYRHLRYVPFICASVAGLTWILHVVLAKGDDYDVSFSDPSLPFSIFISVPTAIRNDAPLRVAEAIIHETMHLQLSLFERLMPLVQPFECADRHFSPWRNEYRDAAGILHGIYVFRVLRDFWEAALSRCDCGFVESFASRRIHDISGELAQVHAFRNAVSLTERGREFVNSLLERPLPVLG
jgi:HEXXH motif-containing protein